MGISIAKDQVASDLGNLGFSLAGRPCSSQTRGAVSQSRKRAGGRRVRTNTDSTARRVVTAKSACHTLFNVKNRRGETGKKHHRSDESEGADGMPPRAHTRVFQSSESRGQGDDRLAWPSILLSLLHSERNCIWFTVDS